MFFLYFFPLAFDSVNDGSGFESRANATWYVTSSEREIARITSLWDKIMTSLREEYEDTILHCSNVVSDVGEQACRLTLIVVPLPYGRCGGVMGSRK